MATAERNDQFTIEVADFSELIIADGSLRESHVDASIFTQFPVGRGSVISDHKQDAPSFLNVDLLITDTPKVTPETNTPDGFQIAAKVLSASGTTTVDTVGPTSFLERGKIVYQRLLEIAQEGLLLTVTTSRRTYENMVLTRVDLPVDSSERATIISCDFQQILFADSQEVPILVVEQPQNKVEVNRGNQETSLDSEDAENASGTTGQTQSILSSILGGL